MAIISRLEPTLRADHTALVLFDPLRGYLFPREPQEKAVVEQRQIVARLQTLVAGARKAGLTVFYPMGQHALDDSDTVARLTDTDMNFQRRSAGGATIKPRYHKGTPEAEIPAELAPHPGDVLIPKHRWSSFFSTDLDFHLKMRAIDTIVIAGGATDVGIASTVFSARDLDLGIVVVRDACYSNYMASHDFFMDRIFPRMGRVMDVDQAVALMSPAA